MKKAKIIGIVSLKGGVGKTTFSTNLASILRQDFKKDVLIVDGSLSCPSVGLHFGYQEPDRTIQDTFNSEKYNISDVIYEHKSGVHLIAASHAKKVKSLKGFKQKIRSLRSFYDFIILDSSPILEEEMDAVINTSDFVFAITTPDHASLASTTYAIKKAKENNVNVMGVILNKIYNKSFELDRATIEQVTKTPIVLSINHDEEFYRALSQGSPLSIYNPKNQEMQSYKRLAAALVKKPIEKLATQEAINRTILSHDI